MSEDLDWEKIADADIDLPSRDCCAAKDARISSLEQTVAKAFLALGEVAEALEPLTCRSTPEHEADDAECEIDVTTGDLRKAKAVRERIMDLCHADASRADSPHRADGALQSDDGEAREENECTCIEFDGEDPFCKIHGDRRDE